MSNPKKIKSKRLAKHRAVKEIRRDDQPNTPARKRKPRPPSLSDRLKEVSLYDWIMNAHQKRCHTGAIGAAGECLACGADQGEACKAANFEKVP